MISSVFAMASGLIAGSLLGISFLPLSMELLAALSTIVFLGSLLLLRRKNGSTLSIIFFLFLYLYSLHAIFYKDYFYILLNKTNYAPVMQIPVFLLMNFQMILVHFIISSIEVYLFQLKLLRKFEFLFLISIVFIIELTTMKQCPPSAFISLSALDPHPAPYFLWGHWGTAFFYYTFLITCLLGLKTSKRYFVPSLIILAVWCLSYFYKTPESKKTITIAAITEVYSKINTTQSLPENIHSALNKLKQEASQQKIDFYFWNEAAILEIRNNHAVAELKKLLAINNPGLHFIGELLLQNRTIGHSYYHLLDTNVEQPLKTYSKKSLVPLDEVPHYFPWMSDSSLTNPMNIVAGNSKGLIEKNGLTFGIALCNEIMDVKMLLNDHILKEADIIINPSNVPQLFSHNFESALDKYSLWIHKISGKPVLRLSAGKYVHYINGAHSFKMQDKFNGMFIAKIQF